MITKIDFENDLKKILNPKIRYCPINEKYHIDGKWANKITLDDIDYQTQAFEVNLLRNLNMFKNPREIIIEFYDSIWGKIEWYKENKIYDFSFWDTIKNNIKTNELLDVPYTADNYTIDYVRSFDFIHNYEDGNLFNVLDDIHRNHGGFNDETILEKGKLINALQLHYKALNTLYHSLYKIEMNFEDMNLDNFTSLTFDRKNNSKSLKCNIDLSKIEIAVLFRFLHETKLFCIDNINQTKNRSNLIRFFEENFNYSTEEGEQLPITRLNNDLSKITLDNKLETQLSTLKNLEKSLHNYIGKIEKKYLNK
nr:hypothetical protein [uncultured Flavobacterium sp.]